MKRICARESIRHCRALRWEPDNEIMFYNLMHELFIGDDHDEKGRDDHFVLQIKCFLLMLKVDTGQAHVKMDQNNKPCYLKACSYISAKRIRATVLIF